MSRKAKTGSIHDRGERRRPGRPFGSTPRRRAGLLLAASLWAGVAAARAEAAGPVPGAGDPRHSSQAVVRASAGYAFHVGALMLAPQVNVDVARSPGLAVSAGLCGGLVL